MDEPEGTWGWRAILTCTQHGVYYDGPGEQAPPGCPKCPPPPKAIFMQGFSKGGQVLTAGFPATGGPAT